MSKQTEFASWFEAHREEIREDLFAFYRFASISADATRKEELLACARWLSSYIAKHTQLKPEFIETDGYPLVFAENKPKDASHTLLIYGHYDVQPIDPIEEWKSDPFTPTERDGKIFVRGAVDDKGQIFYAILAVRAFKELGHLLPLHVKFCIEGEEESASIGLSKSLGRLKEKLACDSLLVVDFAQFDETTPAISLGARGVASFEVHLRGSHCDLHSGAHGGLAYNPNKALVQLLSKLWDDDGVVTVPGFYDGIMEMSEEEKSSYGFPYTKEAYVKEFGIHALGGEKKRSMADNNMFRPVLEINGLGGGYTGEGVKTVIPACAHAKMSVRLTPGQNPKKIYDSIAKFLKQHVEPGISIETKYLGGEGAFCGSPDSKLAKTLMKALEEVNHVPAKKIFSGASIPIMAKMTQELDCEIAGMGYCKASDQIHAPNEHFDWERLKKGYLTVASVLERLS